MDFKIRNFEPSELSEVLERREDALSKYIEAGYFYPANAINLIRETYNQLFTREVKRSGTNELSSNKIDTYRALMAYTEIKLFNKATQAFQKGEDFTISFKNNKPEGDFFNLTNVVNERLSGSRIEAIRTPESFNSKQILSVTVTPDCEIMQIDDAVYVNEDNKLTKIPQEDASEISTIFDIQLP